MENFFLSEWILQPKNPDWDTIKLNDDEARDILKQWKNCVNAELRGVNARGEEFLKEVVNRTDYRLVKGRDIVETVGRKWICNYGDSHKMNEQCGCHNNFGVVWWEFLKWCQDNFKIEHIYQIEDHMRAKFLT